MTAPWMPVERCERCGVPMTAAAQADDTFSRAAADGTVACPATRAPWLAPGETLSQWLSTASAAMRAGTAAQGVAEVYSVVSAAVNLHMSAYDRPHRATMTPRPEGWPPPPECCDWPMRWRPSGWSCRGLPAPGRQIQDSTICCSSLG